ncbi:hypothetical protein SBDP1_520047 [Syntrophobacter sp. SbD1]|nr:hypothetical protein SBDP1_520047 [Syntrophobacter sp. SbD1]
MTVQGRKTQRATFVFAAFDLHGEVRYFVELLLRGGRMLRQDWAGALRDYRDQHTSLELQTQVGGRIF